MDAYGRTHARTHGRTRAPREDDDAVARLPQEALPLLQVVALGHHQLVDVRELHLVDHPPVMMVMGQLVRRQKEGKGGRMSTFVHMVDDGLDLPAVGAAGLVKRAHAAILWFRCGERRDARLSIM